MVRKPSKLKQNTDMKVDGAYADIVAPPRARGDETGQTLNIQNQIDAVGGPLAQEVAATGGMPNVDNLPVLSGEGLFDSPTQNINEPGNQISDTQQIFNPSVNRVEVLKNILLKEYPHRAIKNRLL
tara:strand:- start:54 stop:431 length:378 start_codon:yes stop_codon:yes gene_type:complete